MKSEKAKNKKKKSMCAHGTPLLKAATEEMQGQSEKLRQISYLKCEL